MIVESASARLSITDIYKDSVREMIEFCRNFINLCDIVMFMA